MRFSEASTRRPTDEPPPDFRPWNWRDRSCVELADSTLDFAPPNNLGVIIDVLVETGEQRLRQGHTILRRQSQRLSEEPGGVALHQAIVVIVFSS